MRKLSYIFAAVRSSIALFLLTAGPVFGATGTIFYNTSTAASLKTVRAISADGSNSREIPLSVPSPALPTVSRDGRLLLVTSGGPLSSVMLSQNVYSIDLTAGTTVPITHYVDTLTIDTVVYTNVNTEPDPSSTTYYTRHLPTYKAYSPAGDRVVVMDHSTVSGKPPGGTFFAATSPVLETYAVQQTVPLGNRLSTGAERTTVNQAGDGVDWHPTREELVGPFRADIPSFGNLGESKTEGTVIFVFSTSGTSPLLRALTTPTGRSYVDFTTFYTLYEGEQDHAPAISNDGTKVAYVRNTLVSDSRVGFDIRLGKCAIRIINYDGSGDRELVSFGNNLWITKVAWSPDDTELAFDVAPRLVSNGLELQMGDSTRSEIHIIRTSDASTRLLAGAPAAFPSWSPLSSSLPQGQPPRLVATRAGSQMDLELSNLANGQQLDVETTTDLKRWTTSQTITASTATQKLSIPLSGVNRVQFFRVRLR